jgi:hypothetical protein
MITIYLTPLLDKFRDKTNGKAFGGLLQKIEKDPNLMLELKTVTNFLDSNYSTIPIQQRFFHVWFNITEIEQCPCCQSPKRFSGKFSINDKKNVNYHGTCSSIECQKKYCQVQTMKAIQEKYGVDNISQTKDWHDKIKASNLIKFGTEWQTQSENFKIKTKETWLNNYGETHHTKSQSTKDKKIQTCIERYGVSHVLHDPEIYKRSSTNQFKLKNFVFPSGRIDKVQGYEPFVLAQLLEEGFMEDDIVTDDKIIEQHVGKIFYEDRDGNKHRYYPDIYIISLNKILEVKSEYTMSCNIQKNKLKKEATEKLGILFEYKIWVGDI